MTYVITEACIKCKHTDCVDVCLVDTIFAEDEVLEDQQQFIDLNAELAKSPNWKTITAKKPTPT